MRRRALDETSRDGASEEEEEISAEEKTEAPPARDVTTMTVAAPSYVPLVETSFESGSVPLPAIARSSVRPYFFEGEEGLPIVSASEA